MKFKIIEKKEDFLKKMNFNFCLQTTCGEFIEFYLNLKNDKIEEIFFYTIGSQLNIIAADLICNISFNKNKNNLNELEDNFWNQFHINLNGFRKESIKNLIKNFIIKIQNK